MPRWDNTARRQDTPCILVNGSVLDYQAWLHRIVEQTRQARNRTPDQRLVFINAWNEWGEGCYLEPDVRHGHAYLAATRDALAGRAAVDPLLADVALPLGQNGAARELREAFAARERSLYALQAVIRRKNEEIESLSRQLAQGGPPPTFGAFARHELAKYPRVKGALKRLLGRP
jgi:hypothetical protein